MPNSDDPSQISESVGSQNFINSFARGLSVLTCLSSSSDGVTLSEVARRTELPKASVRRSLMTLTALGFAKQIDNRFAPTSRVLDLATPFLRSLGFPDIAAPVLEAVARQAHEACGAAILEGDDIVFVTHKTTHRIMSTTLSVGSRLPAYVTAVGRAIVSALPEEDREAYLQRVRVVRFTDHTVASRIELRRKISEAIGRGYAIVDQELEDGLRSIAVPVVNGSGAPIGAIDISTHANRVGNRDLVTQCLPLLTEAAAEIEKQVIIRSQK